MKNSEKIVNDLDMIEAEMDFREAEKIQKSMETIKIFMVDEYDWYAAETEEDAIKKAMEELELEKDDFDRNTEVSEEKMNNLIFLEEDEPRKTFRKKLNEMIVAGEKFPCFFATSEH